MLRVIRTSSLLHYSTALVATCAALLFLWPGLVQNLFVSDRFMTHFHCYAQIGPLVAMHYYSDLLIGLSYVAISLTLTYLVYRARRDMPFHWVFIAFGLFIIACGGTHFMEVWTTYHDPVYWLAGYVKLITAVASVATAVVLFPLVPKTLVLVRAAKLSDERHTQLTAANEELSLLYAKIKELDDLKTHFFANVSHELRTPLTLILGPAQKLLAAELPAAQQRDVETIECNAQALLKQVNDLLDIAKLEAGKMAVNYTTTDLAQLVRLTGAYFESFALERAVAFSVDAPPSLPAEADPDKLQRVLLNLLANAFKFTPDGGHVRCALHADGPGRRAIIEVRDSGAGIAPDMRTAIFERFRQGDGTATQRHGGTGLGLAIVKEFVTLHGGTINVSDAPEGGALFRIELPLHAPAGSAVQSLPVAPAHEAVAQTLGVLETEQRAAQRTSAVGPPTCTAAATAEDASTTTHPSVSQLALAPLVLVIEDNAEMSRFISETLAPSYRVAQAFDGRAGIAQARELKPDLILCDVMMPGLGGEEVVEEIRRHEELTDVPVLMLSAKTDERLRVRLLRAGVQDYLLKPFVGAELRARVENLVAVKRERETMQHDLSGLEREIGLRRTEAATTAEALRENHQTLQAIIQASPLAIVVLDPTGLVKLWNAAAETIYGWREQEVLNRPLPTVPPEQQAAMQHDHAAAVAGHSFTSYETQRLRKDGTRIDVSISTAPLTDAAGRTTGVVALVANITDRKLAEESLRRQRDLTTAITASLGEGLVAVDGEGRVTFANPAAERMFGWTADELRGRIVHEVVHYQHADGSPFPVQECPLFAAISAGQAVHSDEDFYVRRDGTLFPVAYTASPIISDGQIGGMVQAFQDITERKLAQEAQSFLSNTTAVLASSLDYEQTLDRVARLSVPFLADCCLVDMKDDETGAIRLMVVAHRDLIREEAWREMRRRWPFKPDADYTIPRVLRTGQPEVYPELTEEILRTLSSDEAQIKTLLSFGIKSSMIVPLVARGRTLGALSFISTESGRQYGAADLALAEELARRAALAIDNARLYNRAQAANRAKDEFLATLSHELRTPLTPIIGWIHMMGTSSISESDVKHGMSVIDKNSQALARLINDLLDMSAIVNGKMRIDHLPVTINQVLQEVIETLRPEAARRQVELELTTCATNTMLLVSGDRMRLGQVYGNLLTNAIKFSAPGGRVHLRCEMDEQEVRVAVEDEGEGIEPEFLPYVFERFRQADMSTTKPHGGLGIGLALVKSFVEAHDGTVRAESAGAGHGSRFIVQLPRMQLPPTGPTDAPTPAAAASAPTQSAPPQTRLLLIEDAPDTLELLRLAFTRRSYHVTTCDSAAAALAVAAREHFDIIISDIGLPHIDGYDLLARLRQAQPSLRAVPAVALTGYATAQDVAAAHTAGFAAHVAKPIDPTTLARVVEELLAQRTPEGKT